MSEYDGQIIIDSHIDTSNFEKDANKISKDMKDLSDKIKNGFKNGKFDLGSLDTSSLEKAKSAMEALVSYKHKIAKELSENIQGGISYSEFIKQSEQLQSAYDKLEKKIIKLKEKSNFNMQVNNSPEPNIVENKKSIYKPILFDSEEFKPIFNSINKIGKSTANNITGYFNSSFQKIKGMFYGISNYFSKLGNSLNKIIGVAKYQALRQFVRSIISEVKKSFVDLATYSKPFNASMQSVVDSFKNFANAIMSIFAPVMSALAPIISTITNMLTGLANNIAFVTNALFGNGQTAVIADTSFQGYSKSLNQTSKETKKAKKNNDDLFKGLAKFDKLDVLNKKKKDSGIGGDVSEVPKSMKMFKEVKIPDNFKKIAEEIKKTFEPLGEFFSRIADTFNTNFVQPILYYWDNNFVPTFSENFNNFASNFNSEPLENALSGLFSALEKLSELSLEQFNWAMQNIIFPLLNWSGEFLIPAAIELLTSSVNLLNAAWDASKDAFKEVFEEYIKPVAQEIGKIIIKIIAKIKVWIDKITEWIKEHPEDFKKIVKFILILSTKLLELIVVIKLVSSAIALVTSVITICKLAFDLLNPEVLLFKLAIVAIIALGAALIVWGDDIKNALVGCWDAIKKACQSMWDAIVDGASWAWNALLDIIQNHPLIKIINLVIRGVNKGLKGINALVGSSFGEIPEINFSAAKIPRHATGTVVSPNHRYLAMLGDNTREPEVVSPISTMEQAMSNVLARTNGGGNVTLQLDGETFARLITPYMNSENTRLGVSMVSGV